MGLTTHFFTFTPQHMSMVKEIIYTGCGEWYRQEKTQETRRVRCSKDVNLVLLHRFNVVQEFNKAYPRYSCLMGSLVQKWPREEPPKQYEFSLILHVHELTHGAHEAHSSPFGSRTLFPKELRIYSYPTHNI
jgi:hypothetical protein